VFSIQNLFSIDLFFSVFSITVIENKVNAKYKTKNNNTDAREVFFAIINQTSANSISKRSLILNAPRVCNVWLLGSFFCPLKKTKMVISDINAKTTDKIARSLGKKFTFPVVISI
jgi:hypothetical protein